jgi:hypothetical protein
MSRSKWHAALVAIGGMAETADWDSDSGGRMWLAELVALHLAQGTAGDAGDAGDIGEAGDSEVAGQVVVATVSDAVRFRDQEAWPEVFLWAFFGQAIAKHARFGSGGDGKKIVIGYGYQNCLESKFGKEPVAQDAIGPAIVGCIAQIKQEATEWEKLPDTKLQSKLTWNRARIDSRPFLKFSAPFRLEQARRVLRAVAALDALKSRDVFVAIGASTFDMYSDHRWMQDDGRFMATMPRFCLPGEWFAYYSWKNKLNAPLGMARTLQVGCGRPMFMHALETGVLRNPARVVADHIVGYLADDARRVCCMDSTDLLPGDSGFESESDLEISTGAGTVAKTRKVTEFRVGEPLLVEDDDAARFDRVQAKRVEFPMGESSPEVVALVRAHYGLCSARHAYTPLGVFEYGPRELKATDRAGRVWEWKTECTTKITSASFTLLDGSSTYTLEFKVYGTDCIFITLVGAESKKNLLLNPLHTNQWPLLLALLRGLCVIEPEKAASSEPWAQSVIKEIGSKNNKLNSTVDSVYYRAQRQYFLQHGRLEVPPGHI